VTGARAPVYLALTRASLALAAGDEEIATALIGSLTGEAAAGRSVDRGLAVALPFLALVYVLAPGTRAGWDAMELGADHRIARDAARAFVVARAGTPTRVDIAPERVMASLGVPWTLELAATTGDIGLAEACVRVVPDASRRALRVLGAPGPLMDAVAQLRRRVPVPPADPVVLRVLGPARLVRAGVDVDHPDWRRERVRSLLQYLVVRRRATRAEVAEALWPDLDGDAGAGNLRVTLRYLQRLLEPERETGEATWFVRTEGDVLQLAEHGLTVDLWELERGLDEAAAAEAEGRTGDALRSLEAALDQWRGELLAGVYDDWAGAERDRVRARFVAGSIRAAELLAARGDVDRAVATMVRALEAEPWSERGYQVLVEAHLARTDRAAARRALERCRAMLDDLGVDPDPVTVALAERVRAG
jgi:DNA-binding SARP family transcriptional activator